MSDIWSCYRGWELILRCFDRVRTGPKGREIHYARFAGSTREESIQNARDKGWVFFGDMENFVSTPGNVYAEANALAFCPYCVTRGRKPPVVSEDGVRNGDM